ncbi:hypothetical protein G6F46_001125 [Rhizopus delemar]|uniref:Tyr recombinase domain-containing protein n=1 Tax=Rhizopus delemar TaxID=936053 RepID=A0A9P6YS76_9FUNG|nr:hypothetical protein G6F54_011801 [Rhizopus delemar]KAG1497687.1 hypothetical protein G6F53_011913 [Rhizopus delemar]KAG1511606.1 hypothetical protein G6F52_010608 [Rhizopus delemar]KAG1545202.1 hypothetical protein G6F49_010864 [Rhizopus delemar]KAG1563536.1 hypothetical protein G6F50_011910 [Rhizopus delemar]
MSRPRSDIGRLQFQDIIFKFEGSNNSIPTGVKIHFREPKENQVKTTRLGLLQDTRICPVSTLYLFISKSNDLRANLPTYHTLFLAHIEKPEQVAYIRPSTMSSWVKSIMERPGIGTTIYKAHSIRSASSTKAVEKGHSIQAVKEHAGWSLNSNTFERFYYKPTNQDSSSTAITHSIFSQAENSITLGDGVEPTEIDLGTTNNPNVGETKSNNVIDAHPWYRRYLGF